MNTKNIASTLKDTGAILMGWFFLSAICMITSCQKKDDAVTAQMDLLKEIRQQEVAQADNRLKLGEAQVKYGDSAPKAAVKKVEVQVKTDPTPAPAPATKTPAVSVTPVVPVAPAATVTTTVTTTPAPALTAPVSETAKQVANSLPGITGVLSQGGKENK